MNSILSLTQQERTLDEDRSPVDEDRSPIKVNSSLVRSEVEWFKRPRDWSTSAEASSQAILARWTPPESSYPIELSSRGGDDSLTLTFFLRSTRGEWTFGDRPFHEGQVPSASLWIKEPFQGAQAIYSERSASFRVYLPQPLLAECYEATYGRPSSRELILFKTMRTNDRILTNLVRMLVDIDKDYGPTGPIFLDGVSLALAARLIVLDSRQTHRSFDKLPSALATWRLNRSIDYIEANLMKPIYLLELSNAVGLSRMHFAAQFRAATGYSPNRYILRRKIAFAQHLLRDPLMPIVDIALILGFRSQAHFTVVFKNIVGYPPAQWRKHLF